MEATELRGSSESVSLVKRETIPEGAAPPHPLDEEEEWTLHSRARFHEESLNQAGFGAFHWLVLLISGLGLASDAIELFVVSYILPSAEQELCMEEYHKGWLGTISFVGMMIGGVVWGILGDRLGRRRTLLSALATSGIFGVITAFMPTYSLFMITRLCSGVGIGGTLPVVFTYFSEFLVRKQRGRLLSLLLMFWAVGGIFVTVLAWGIMPKTGVSILESKRLHFGRWRVFLVVCSLPALVSSVGMAFLPESPRFLLEMGRDGEALYVYKRIFAMNNAEKIGAEYQLTEMQLPGKRLLRPISIPAKRGLFREIGIALSSFLDSYMQMLTPPNTRLTLFLLGNWATASFGFYGMSIWFPEYLKSLEKVEFELEATRESHNLTKDVVLNSTIGNTHFSNYLFLNVRFTQMLFSHSTFSNCSFSNCTFSDVRSSRSYFHECDFQQTVFIDTDFYSYKFHSCNLTGADFFSTKGGCNLDFDINFKLSDLFFENLFAQLALVPGTLLSYFALDRIGRVKTMGVSLMLAGPSVCLLWFLHEKKKIILLEAIFNFVSISGWNALDVISTEAYPANIRTTSYGFLSTIGRLTAILSNVTFVSFVGYTKAVPILTSALVLLVGAACTTQLPETKDYLI